MVASKTTSYRIVTVIIYAILLFAAFLSLAPLINTIAISFSSSTAANSGQVTFLPVDFTTGSYEKNHDRQGVLARVFCID